MCHAVGISSTIEVKLCQRLGRFVGCDAACQMTCRPGQTPSLFWTVLADLPAAISIEP